MNFFDKVAAFKDKYDYADDRESYVAERAIKPINSELAKKHLAMPAVFGGMGALGGLFAPKGSKLISSAILGAGGAALGGAAALANMNEINGVYKNYKRNQQHIDDEARAEFNAVHLPALQQREDYIAKMITRHPTEGLTETQARELYRTGDREIAELIAMEADEYHNSKLTHDQFAKHASEYIYLDDIPNHVVKAAHAIYESNPELNAKTVLRAYDATEDSNAKLAFEVLGAVLVKQANPLALAGSALRSFGKQTALHAGMLGAGMALGATQKKDTLAQGSEAVKQEEVN